jgi:hypothetical protein
MGIFDTAKKVTLLFAVDTKDAEKGLEKLKGKERELAEESIATQKTLNESLSSHAKNLIEVGVAWQAVQTGISFASDAAEEYVKWADEAGGADKRRADEFRKSLDDWGDAMKSVKIAIGEMVVAFAPAIESLSKVVALSAQAIAMQSNPGKFFGDDAGKALDYLGYINPVTAPWKVGGKALGFVNDQFTSSAGTGPTFDSSQIDNAWNRPTTANSNSDAYARYQQRLRFDPLNKRAEGLLAQSDFVDSILGGYGTSLAGIANPSIKPPKKKGHGGSGSSQVPDYFVQAEDGTMFPVFTGNWDLGLGTWGAPKLSSNFGAAPGAGPTTAQLGDAIAGAAYGRQLDDYASQLAGAKELLAAQGQRESLLAKVFGPLDEFNAYGEAFGVLTDAVGAAYKAMVTGSEGAGKALKQEAAAGLLAIGEKEAVLAISELGAAVGSLAIGGPLAGASAAAHFKSAALHGAAAAAAGVGARELGAGGVGGAAGSGGGGAALLPGGGGAIARPPERITVIVGDSLSDGTARQKANDVGRLIRNAEDSAHRTRGVRNG